MNILVTGANGQLGNEMRILARSSRDRYIFTDVNQAEGVETLFLDITDPEAVRSMVAEYGIGAIVNCAAYTNVDAAESNEQLAEKLNADAPENLARAMKEANGLLVQISTDYVFGKEPYNVPCREEQQGTPTGVYGLTKLHGEQKILASGCKHPHGLALQRVREELLQDHDAAHRHEAPAEGRFRPGRNAHLCARLGRCHRVRTGGLQPGG